LLPVDEFEIMSPKFERPVVSVVVIMLAVAVWCGVIAVGVFRQTDPTGAGNGIKSAIVVGVMVAFLGVWWTALKRVP
jgi:cation transporter-like permease